MPETLAQLYAYAEARARRRRRLSRIVGTVAGIATFVLFLWALHTNW